MEIKKKTDQEGEIVLLTNLRNLVRDLQELDYGKELKEFEIEDDSFIDFALYISKSIVYLKSAIRILEENIKEEEVEK